MNDGPSQRSAREVLEDHLPLLTPRLLPGGDLMWNLRALVVAG